MQKFTNVTSRVIPLAIKDVDTDMIIPAQYLTQISQGGYGQHVFQRLKESDESFCFNQSKYQGAEILLTSSNFGCGSSREHAVWALQEAGIKVIIAESFSDIFFSNSEKNGLLLIMLPKEIIKAWFEIAINEDLTLTVDLEMQYLKPNTGKIVNYYYDPFRKHCLLNGIDDLDYLLSYIDKIESYEKSNEI